MKKNGFTLMEVMLSIILFSLMVGAILGSYNSIQRASIKTANTQDALQVAEDFLERINDMSLEYQIDTGKYSDEERFGHREIINTGALHLKNNNGKENTFYRECSDTKCSLFMDDNGTKINLINNDKVNVTNLQFTIYPNDQYVNTDITAKVDGGESLYKSGITLSTSVGFKHYTMYGGEITPETLCEDVCSVTQLQSNAMSNAQATHGNIFKNNTSMSSCTLGYKAGRRIEWFGFIPIPVFSPATVNVFEMAYKCAHNQSLGSTFPSSWTCGLNCPISNDTNPFSCGYIRKRIAKDTYTGNTCSGYDEHVWGNACVDMCLSTIFTCSASEENEVIKRTGIKITSGSYAGKYLQNPKIKTKSIQKTNWTCNAWGGVFTSLFWSDPDNIYCKGDLSDRHYNINCNITRQEYSSIGIEEYYTLCNSNSTETKSYYTDQTQFSGDKSCECKVAYGYSIFASGGVVEAGVCAGGKEETVNNSNTQYAYSPKYITYIGSDGFTGRWRGISVKKDTSYYGLYKEENSLYDQCECTNSYEYQECLASGCCDEPSQEKKAYEITAAASACSTGITTDKNKSYCTNKLGLAWNNADQECYPEAIDMQQYCASTRGGALQNGTNNCITGPSNIDSSFCPNGYKTGSTCYPNTNSETLQDMKNSCIHNSSCNNSCDYKNTNFYLGSSNPIRVIFGYTCLGSDKINNCCYETSYTYKDYCTNKRNGKIYANNICYKAEPYTKQSYCENNIHGIRQNNLCYNGTRDLRKYCEEDQHGVRNGSEHKCFLDNPSPLPEQDVLQYFCEQSNDRTRYDNGCRRNTNECLKTYCVQPKNGECPEDTEPLTINHTTYNYCYDIDFDICKKGINKNIYKDYDYTCEGSIIGQSSIITNIIENIGNVSHTTRTNGSRWSRRFNLR